MIENSEIENYTKKAVQFIEIAEIYLQASENHGKAAKNYAELAGHTGDAVICRNDAYKSLSLSKQYTQGAVNYIHAAETCLQTEESLKLIENCKQNTKFFIEQAVVRSKIVENDCAPKSSYVPIFDPKELVKAISWITCIFCIVFAFTSALYFLIPIGILVLLYSYWM